MRSRRPLVAIALVLAMATGIGLVPGASAGGTTGPDGTVTAAAVPTPLDPLIPTADSLATVAAGLPDDPIDATESLVTTIFGGDDVAAVAATGELLRRAGLPLVSAAAPVIALPDGLTIISDPIDVELLPMLTRSVRDGTEFTPAQLAGTLTYLGVTGRTLPASAVVGTLAAWGKDSGAPAESVVAGSAVRALARARGQLLVPAAMPDAKILTALHEDPESLTAQQLSVLSAPGRLSGLDPLTFILLVAHASGEVVGRAEAVPAGEGPPGLRRPGSAAGTDCQSLKDSPDAGKAVGKKILRDDIKAGAGMVKESYGEAVGEAFETYDKGTDVITTTMLLLGATIDLVADPTSTHFRHESGDPSRDVWFVANAAFNGPLAAQHLACWGLAGIDVPPNGPLNGFRVRWEIFGSLPVLQTKTDDSDKLLHGESTTDGVSTLWMYPRTETHPPKSGESIPEQTVGEIVIAKLDKDDFPFKMTDLLGLAGPEEAALSKAWDIAVAWIGKVGLPNKAIRYPVSFHAANPYVIQAHTTIDAFGFAKAELDTDLYSCTGPAGPWKGTITLTGTAEALLIAAGKVAGASGKTSGSVTYPMNFTVDPTSPMAQHIPFAKDLELNLAFYPDQVQATEHPETLNDNWDRLGNRAIVGDGSFVSGGEDLRKIALTTASGMVQGEEYQIVGVMRDPRCPGATYWDDHFDSE